MLAYLLQNPFICHLGERAALISTFFGVYSHGTALHRNKPSFLQGVRVTAWKSPSCKQV
jgi:hypothetical protein